MPEAPSAVVAIVDYGMGNLFSVMRACEQVGMQAAATTSRAEILSADAVIVPGVGAFGDAMDTLMRLDLVGALREVAASGKPLIGICLGMQLLMERSHEFGLHDGLKIIEGEVVRLPESHQGGRRMKVPQVGWNRISKPSRASWEASWLRGVAEGEFMYFVHSFYVSPADQGIVLSTTRYGSVEFCSSLQRGNVFACQFHPERSGPQGLRLYRNIADHLRSRREGATAWQSSSSA